MFKTSLKISPLFIAIAATIPTLGQAAEETKAEGFVEGSSLKLNARNYYTVSYTHLTLPTIYSV